MIDTPRRSALGDFVRSSLGEISIGGGGEGVFLKYSTFPLGHGTCTMELGGEEEVFATEGVTRLGATLRLADFVAYNNVDPLPREARTLITKSEYSVIQTALRLGPSGQQTPDVVAIGQSLVPVGQQIGAQLLGGRTAVLRYHPAPYPQPAVAAMHPDDVERIYEGTSMEYQVSIPPGTNSIEIAFGTYAYSFIHSLTTPGTYEIDQPITDAPDVALSFSSLRLKLSQITGTLVMAEDGAITGTIVPHFKLGTTSPPTQTAKTRRASNSNLVTLDELLGPEELETDGQGTVHQITRYVVTDGGPAPGLVVTYFEYNRDANGFLPLTEARGYKVGLSDEPSGGFVVTSLDVYEVKRWDFDPDEVAITLNVYARTRGVTLPNGPSEPLTTPAYSRGPFFSGSYANSSNDGTFPVATYQGRSYEISRTKHLVLYADGLLACAVESAGRTWYLYGEQLPDDPPISTGFELGRGFVDEVITYTTTTVDLEERFTVYTDTDLGFVDTQFRFMALDAEFLRAKAIPFVKHSVLSLNSSHALVLIWPHAATTKAGVCILKASNWATFHSALSTAMDAKQAGEPYQTLLDEAIALLSYKVNNFASWELVSKFATSGLYYIAT